MIDRRNCIDCIFHDGYCHRWDCKHITRQEAEEAVDKIRENTNEGKRIFITDQED